VHHRHTSLPLRGVCWKRFRQYGCGRYRLSQQEPIPADVEASDFKLVPEYKHNAVYRIQLVYNFEGGAQTVLSSRLCSRQSGRRTVTIWSGLATALEHGAIRLEISTVTFFETSQAAVRAPRPHRGRKKGAILNHVPVHTAEVTADVFFLPGMLQYTPSDLENIPASETLYSEAFGSIPRCFEDVDMSALLEAMRFCTFTDVADQLQVCTHIDTDEQDPSSAMAPDGLPIPPEQVRHHSHTPRRQMHPQVPPLCGTECLCHRRVSSGDVGGTACE
jgi:hypothetical protein